MCGIAGLVGARPSDLRRIEAMTSALAHRGPDDEGHWTDASAGVAFGQRRLAIIDLSPAGHQPMVSASGRYVLVLNGEIYNFQSLRAAVERVVPKVAWRGSSDTEVLLAAFEVFGIRGGLERAIGMFALALWDREQGEVHLARDRMGEKPLYYGWVEGALVFGSELKALRAYPGFDAGVDREALARYLRFGYVPAPQTIHPGARKLPPATFLTYSLKAPDARPEPIPYWSLADVLAQGAREPIVHEEAALAALDARLRDAVREAMVSDVPLGVFLSGGVDSSLVTALMQAQSATPVRTFSIGFREDAFNEADQARAVAEHLGTDHTEFTLTSEEARAVIPQLAAIYDEPFADSSQIPTLLVSQLARRSTTVALSGDGGDEIFGGYQRYTKAAALWRRSSRVPRPLRQGASRAILSLSPSAWTRALRPFRPLLRKRIRSGTEGVAIHKAARALGASDFEAFYRDLVSVWPDPSALVLGARQPAAAATTDVDEAIPLRMMRRDVATYLPDDIFVKVDRASMAVALETRAPLVDKRVVELAARLPIGMKVRDGEGKVLLRRLLARYVPPALTDRPKTGFAVPIAEWLRGPLRTWAEALLDEDRLRREGNFQPAPIREAWTEHLSGKRDRSAQLWAILMFQAWWERSRA